MRGRIVRFAQTVGLALGCRATIFVLGVLFIGCDASGPTRPEPVAAPPQAPVAAPAPAPTATPTAVDPTQPSSFELSCLPGSSLSVKYTGQASQATVETFYTTFDNQELVFGKQSHLVNTGGTVDRTFPDVCIQGDADQPGVKLIGGCFYDINGKPFNPSREPAKITECRSRCVEKWIESEPVREKESEWSKCVAPETDSFQANGEGCYGTKSRTYELVVYEVNSCTKAKREKSRTQKTEEERCEIECPCVERGTGVKDYKSPAWSGLVEQGACVYGPPQSTTPAFGEATIQTCHENGTQDWLSDYTCREDEGGTINVCRSVTCPCVPTYTTRTAKENYTEWSDGVCGKRYYDLVEYKLNSCTQEETRTVIETHVKEELKCETSDLCHISNKGVKDGQVNLVITEKGHLQHADSTKFCPPDLLQNVCSCDSAIAAAKACGIEADGGFFCKDERH